MIIFRAREGLNYTRANVPILAPEQLFRLAPFIIAAVYDFDDGVILQGRN